MPWWVWCRGKPHPALGPASFSSMVPPLKDGAEGNRTRPCLLLQLGHAAQGRCMAVRKQSPQAGRNLEAHTAAATPFLSPTPPVAQNRDSASSLYTRRCPPILRQGEAENVTQIVLHAPPPRLACVVSAAPTPLPALYLAPSAPRQQIRRPILDIRHEANLDADFILSAGKTKVSANIISDLPPR